MHRYPKRRFAFVCITGLILGLFLIAGCEDKKSVKTTAEKTSAPKAASLSIVSGSENKELEPLIRSFALKEGLDIQVTYQGSVDMMLMLAEQGAGMPFDAVWPANSLWITLGDTQKIVKHAESIMRSPVVLGVKKSIAEKLGWVSGNQNGKQVAISDILSAAESGSLRFAMTSATQSNSGASAYLGFLHAMAGSPDILGLNHLEEAAVQEKVRRLLSTIDRSSGSSGWLKDSVVKHFIRFQAMFNYEAMLIEANQELTRMGKEPLYAVYPADGIMIADSPLGYVDKKDKGKEALFKKLQAFLLSDAVQKTILAKGRRTGIVGMMSNLADPKIFNPDWGIHADRIISPIPTPSEPVIRKALELYQISLRKPSCTAYVVDVSGSMQGSGISDLKSAMTMLLDPDQAKRYMLQASPKDIHIILPFNNVPQPEIREQGNSDETLGNLLSFVQNLKAGGGTDIYSAASRALEILSRIQDPQNYFSAIILMTDGKSQGDIQKLKETMEQVPGGKDIPIFSITFGEADETQLKAVSEVSMGRVFPGKNLVKAFRSAKGYN